MKYRWLREALTLENIEAITGKKVKRITSGDLDTGVEGEATKGIEIEFDGDVPENKLVELDKQFVEFKRKKWAG